MSAKDWILIACFLAMGAVGAYMMAAPRRLFTRAEDPARYRPEAVEYDSEQGRWLRTRAGPMLIALSLILIATRLL